MTERRGEKLGWTLGWSGGFVWVPILAGVAWAHGKALQAVMGLLLAGVAGTLIRSLAPWRHARTPYLKLMLPIYGLLAMGVAWGVWAAGDPRKLGINGWASLLTLLPITLPLWLVGRRRWEDRQGDR